jgi:hypothetical protein
MFKVQTEDSFKTLKRKTMTKTYDKGKAGEEAIKQKKQLEQKLDFIRYYPAAVH